MIVLGWQLALGVGGAEAASSIVAIAPTPTYTAPVPVGLAGNGMVVGNSGAQPFTWTATGGYRPLAATSGMGYYSDTVTGVSPTGEVLGEASNASFDGVAAIIWPAGATGATAPTTLGCYMNSACGVNTNSSYARAANAAGTVVGTQNKNGVTCGAPQFGCAVPTLWPGSGSPVEVGTATGTGLDINASGSVLWAGNDGYHVTTASGDSVITCLSAVHINANGAVIGESAGPVVKPAFWVAGSCGTLPLLASTPASAGGAAEGINDQNVIVGRCGASGSSTAVEWVGGQVTNLNTLLPPGSGWVLQDANAINSAGQILGTGTLNGTPEYFLLSGGSLSLAISPKVPPGGLSVGSSLTVPVTVTANGGSVSGISLSTLGVGSAGAVKVTATPTGTTGFSLATGQSRTFTYTVTGVKSGQAVLSLTAGAAGVTPKSASTTFPVVQKAIKITMAADPGKVTLEADDKGEVAPKTIKVRVRIANTTKKAVEDVKLLSLDPVPADPTQQLDKLAFPKKALPVKFGKLAGGASKLKTLTLKVTGDGTYVINALALYDDSSQAGGNGRAVAQGGKFTVSVPALFYVAKRDSDNISEKDSGAYVRAGATWYVSATIKNESSYKSLCVLPMAPALTGNAAATGPVNIAQHDLRDIGGPFAGVLKPQEKVSLSMFVDTSPEGAPSGAVKLAPDARLLEPGQPCNAGTAGGLAKLGDDGKKIVKGSTEFTTHVDLSAPLVPPRSGAANAVTFFGSIGKSLFVDTFEQLLELGALARSTYSTEKEYGYLNGVFPGGAQAYKFSLKAAQALYVATDVYANYWRTATATEKDSLFYAAGNVLYNVSGDFFNDATATVREAATPFMNDLTDAYAHGDDERIWKLWGKIPGGLLSQAVTLVFTEVLGARLVKSEAALEKVSTDADIEWFTKDAEPAIAGQLSPDTALTEVPPGTIINPATEAPALWGVDEEFSEGALAIADDEQVLIGVRARGPGSIAEIEKGSVVKSEQMKPKNVDDIDTGWLGFPADSRNQVRFRTFTDKQIAAITQKVRDSSLSVDQKLAVLDRLETRIGEAKYLKTIEGYSKKGEIYVGFNYRDNGITKTRPANIRRFHLESSPIEAADGIPAGGDIYTPLQENLDLYQYRKGNGALPANCRRVRLFGSPSVLCTISGDVDGVYVTALDGGAVPQAKLLRVYKRLQALGWQHPETLTWINNQGEFFFGAKANILAGLQQGKGGEAMLEYSPGRKIRATYLDLSQSSLLGKNNNDYRVRIVGGATDATP